MRTALAAGAGLVGSVFAGLLLAGPAQADSGEAADAASGLAGGLVAAATTPAADVVAESVAEIAEPVTEATEPVAEITEPATQPVVDAAEPVDQVTDQVTEVVEPVEQATEATEATAAGASGALIESVDGLAQDTGEVVVSAVDQVESATDQVLAVVPSVTDQPVLEQAVPDLALTDVLAPDVLAPDGPLAPVLPIPLPIPDPVVSLLAESGQAPLAGASITTATVDLGGVDGDRDQDRPPQPGAGPGLGWGGLPLSTSVRPPPVGSDPSPVDQPGRPFGQFPMTGSHQHVGNPIDTAQPLCAAIAALTQPTADSVCMRLPDELAAVGPVMTIATPPG